MIQFGNTAAEVVFYCLVGIGAVILLVLGYQVGRWAGRRAAARTLAERERDLFTTQKGFKELYERDAAELRRQNAALQEQVTVLTQKVDDYRRKAAGFGGLFHGRGRRAEAMYALLLENETLEETLFTQNEKLRQERTEVVKEQLRSTSYRRVLLSQILKDQRVRRYAAEVLADEKRLPPMKTNPALPEAPPPGT